VRPAAAAAAPTAEAPATVAEVRPSSASRSDPQAELARAAELIARGRNSEAMPLLERILAAHPRQANARQALATLQFETGQPLRSLATLLEGAAIDAGFAVPAAQLQAALGDVAGALATLERVPAAARTPAQHALHGGLAHRLGRHALAVDSYRQALRSPQAEAVWWLGLGLAHEGAAQPEAARAALKQALAQTSLAPEQRSFAQQRLLAIRAGDLRADSVAAATP
jgi:Tfp pilus assembly protein PilF